MIYDNEDCEVIYFSSASLESLQNMVNEYSSRRKIKDVKFGTVTELNKVKYVAQLIASKDMRQQLNEG